LVEDFVEREENKGHEPGFIEKHDPDTSGLK